ncbi:hypothetical protein Nepgr_018944 [Nepenthes gracilis]|uniref:Uncharacterized protein n=1 Tax=Nepenthes gracilis TaxID=150966 RepID=A0AAD3SSA1_NEPGR|nr:hypothetical protein Nepgr_018944 [Nepenthes gracilis]
MRRTAVRQNRSVNQTLNGEPSTLPVGVSSEPTAEESIKLVCVPTLSEHDVPIAAIVLPKETASGLFTILVEGSFGGRQLVKAKVANVVEAAAPVEASRTGTLATGAREGQVAPLLPSTSKAPFACSGASTSDWRPRSASSSWVALSVATEEMCYIELQSVESRSEDSNCQILV